MSKVVILAGRGNNWSGPVRPLKVDDDDVALHIYNYVFNPTSLQWERMKQPFIDASGNINVELKTANLENMIINMHDTISILSKKITLLTNVLMEAIGGGTESLTLDDIPED